MQRNGFHCRARRGVLLFGDPRSVTIGQMSPTPVILDVDPGHDDAVALMLACGAPELEVRAVT
ncbi:MAG: ribonucleoside hydrolase, partial [Actinomycetota bacterium]|nr:ribonucleoside hydrolase [Actinomycetota bacterium]